MAHLEEVKQTKSDNELIAEFMGWSSCKTEHDTFWNPVMNCTIDNWVYHSFYLQFNSSWNWLMPVVEKIAAYRIAYPEQTEKVCGCKIVIDIEHLYAKVVEFIKWYNRQNPTPHE